MDLGQRTCLLKLFFFSDNYLIIFISTVIKVARYNQWKKKEKSVLLKSAV